MLNPPENGAAEHKGKKLKAGDDLTLSRLVYILKNGFLIVLRKMFARLGRLIGHCPYLFILLTLFTTGLSWGIKDMKFSSRMRDGYTPMDAPSRRETAVYRSFHGTGDIQPQRTMMLILATDGGSMLRRQHLAAAVNVTDYIYHNFTIEFGGANVTYDQLCGTLCSVNLPTKMFSTAFDEYTNGQLLNTTSSSHLKILYPVTRHNNIPIQLERFLSGVQLKDVNSSIGSSTNIKYVKIVTGFFFADARTERDNDVLTKWELALFDMIYGGEERRGRYDRSLITVEVIGDKMMGSEMIKSGTTLAPYFGIGFLFMVVFVALSILGSAAYHQSLHWGKVLVAMGTLLSPIFAISTTFGLISYMSYEIYPIIMVIPFLVLAIGVDDAFLMNHAWYKCLEEMPSDGYRRIPDVMSAVLVDVGPSITITSLTNTLAFGIGSTMSTPIIGTFCRATAIAMALDYAFELMFFGSLLAISGRFDKRGSHASANCRDVAHYKNGSNNGKTAQDPVKPAGDHRHQPADNGDRNHRHASTVSRLSLPSRPSLQKCGRRLLMAYCRLLTNNCFRAGLLVLLLAYWAGAIVGVVEIRPYISSKKVLPPNTPLLRPDELLHKYIWMEYHALHIFVYKPPNLNNATEMERFYDMINTYERLDNSKGRDATQLWLRDYEDFLESQDQLERTIMDTFGLDADEYNIDDYYEDEDEQTPPTNSVTETTTRMPQLPRKRDYSRVDAFLDSVFFQHWRSFVRTSKNLRTNETQVDSFVFIMGFKNVSTWIERTMLMDTWRNLVVPYRAQFNMTLYESNAYLYDAILNLKASAFWTVGYTLVCMLGVCLLFIPSLRGLLVGGVAIVSISGGVVGFLTWWGYDLDPITMSFTLMAVGFSVDFTAHVSYHYQRACEEIEPGNNHRLAKVHRLAFTLGAVGCPMLQAGASTVVCIVPLVVHAGYTPSVFVKSITLVVSWGLLHGLLVLPCVLAALPDCCSGGGAQQRDHQAEQGEEDALARRPGSSTAGAKDATGTGDVELTTLIQSARVDGVDGAERVDEQLLLRRRDDGEEGDAEKNGAAC